MEPGKKGRTHLFTGIKVYMCVNTYGRQNRIIVL